METQNWLASFYHLIVSHTDGLYTVVFTSRFFFLDLWSCIHFASGAAIMAALRAVRCSRPFGVLLVILFLYEVLELSFTYLAVNLFRPEILPDQVTDVVVGLVGGGLMWVVAKLQVQRVVGDQLRRWLPTAVELSVAVVMSGIWVASYGYCYNVPLLNSPAINWWAFLLWSLGLFATIKVFKHVRKAVGSGVLASLITWLLYLLGLFVVEFIGYRLMGIHEQTNEGPFLFGLIHGSQVLKAYYVTAGVLVMALHTALEWILQRRRACAPPRAQAMVLLKAADGSRNSELG